MKYSKKIIKKICTSVFCMVLSLCMVLRNEVMTAYAWSNEELALYDYNTSDQIYKWTRVRSVNEMQKIFEGEGVGKDKRLLLIPAVSHGEDNAPTFEDYYIFPEEKDELRNVSISDNPYIDLSKDEFYSQGGFRTPYIEYDGMTDDQYVQDCFGEPSPTIRLFTVKKDDTRGTKVLYNGWDIHNEYKQKTCPADQADKLDLIDSEEYHWEIGFPAQHEHTVITNNYMLGKEYHKHIKDTVQLGVKIVELDHYLLINDDYAMSDNDWRLILAKNGGAWCYYSESYYICYIGVESTGTHELEGTQVIGNGQTMVLDKQSFLKPNASIVVNKGGTLFVTGEFINSGTIMINGGTMVLQKGAWMHANNTSQNVDGKIYIEGGDLIVREGARMVNFDPDLRKNEHQCSLYIKPGGMLVNRGLIALSGDVNVWATGEFKNQGVLAIGCLFLNSKILYHPYSPETTDLTADEFARTAVEDMKKNILFFTRKYVKLLDINGSDKLDDRGVWRDEGEFYVSSN